MTENRSEMAPSEPSYSHEKVLGESKCKYFLYRTVGSSEESPESGYKVYDIAHLVPSVLFLLFLIYSLPRTRQKLSGAPLLFNTTHILLLVTCVCSILRCLLMFMAPSPNDDTASMRMEKVTWALTHGTNICLELVSFVIFILPVLPSNKSSQRLLVILATFSTLYSILMSIIEIHSPTAPFHVEKLNYRTDLFGDGGAVFTLIFSLLSAVAYSCLISLRVFQKGGSRRSSTFTYSIVMLGVQGTRTLGAILLAAEVQFGMCLTNLTFYLLMQFLPPLVFLCILSPYLQTTQSHSLLGQSSFRSVGLTEEDDWLEDDYDLYTAPTHNDPLGINR